jgi:hypothetical protein
MNEEENLKIRIPSPKNNHKDIEIIEEEKSKTKKMNWFCYVFCFYCFDDNDYYE